MEFVLFYTTNLYKFLANNFFYVHFFQIFSTDLKSAENSAFFDTHLLKKKLKKFGVMEYIYEYFLEIVECKFARNGLTN